MFCHLDRMVLYKDNLDFGYEESEDSITTVAM